MPDVVVVGSRVCVRYEDGFETEYEIVSEGAEDPADGHISPKMPIGKAILGARKGDIRQYGTSGKKVFEVRIIKIY